MNDLNQHLSKIVSPFDDDDPVQADMAEIGYMEFQKKELLNAIPLKNSRKTFDLYFEDTLSELEDKSQFVMQCFERLVQTYTLSMVYDKVQREHYFIDKIDNVIECIDYICTDKWLDSFIPSLPAIGLETIVDGEMLYDFLNANIDSIRIKIIKQEQINELIRYEIEYAPNEECVNFLYKLIQKDIPGVVSVQLVTKK